ncbi:hypothetical protein C5E45_19080 [Nocardia nova]|uniref:Xaa-Pro dipeptidyl-peptidase-like domain-containing protein n=1 Tax=Nocardia nova TaxID=37330 RepID=A0A2S6AMS1_9NOCA|nr:hypothetical protein C5E45_19080 [Nocardia nova]
MSRSRSTGRRVSPPRDRSPRCSPRLHTVKRSRVRSRSKPQIPSVKSLFASEDYLVERGYIAVIAEVRGRGGSGGQFDFWSPREAADGVKLAEGAARLPNSNGKVGLFGASYMGVTQYLTAGAAYPDSPIKAAVPVSWGNSVTELPLTWGNYLTADTGGRDQLDQQRRPIRWNTQRGVRIRIRRNLRFHRRIGNVALSRRGQPRRPCRAHSRSSTHRLPASASTC